MNDTPAIRALSSTSYGAQRMLWAFGQDAKAAPAGAYLPARDVGQRLEGLVATAAGLQLASGAAAGSMETDPIEAPAFDWLVPWWNAETAGAGTAEFFAQAETSAGWTGWFSLGRWGRVASSFSRAEEAAKVEADTLTLPAKARRYRFKVELSAGPDGAGAALLRRCGVITRDKASERPATRLHYLKESAAKVPPRSQMVEAEGVKGRICSPTCAAMALQWLGIDLPTAFVAADCWDSGEGIYGNWPFNVASLWRLGARARLEFFPNIEATVGELFAGRVIIASVKFGEGALTGAPIKKTNGHLVLLRGLRKTETGGYAVLVNDPAAGDPAEVSRAYDLAEFERAWSGVGYLIEGRR
ncbi:C39 family peptidase [bacterium]|nr:C39 family peptidase [bacterium]